MHRYRPDSRSATISISIAIYGTHSQIPYMSWKPLIINTHQWVLKDFRVFVQCWWIDGDSVSFSDQVLLATVSHKVCVLGDVTNHKDTARQTSALLHYAVCKQVQSTSLKCAFKLETKHDKGYLLLSVVLDILNEYKLTL